MKDSIEKLLNAPIRLAEMCEELQYDPPSYEKINEIRKDTRIFYEYIVEVNGTKFSGIDISKRLAKRRAALEAVFALENDQNQELPPKYDDDNDDDDDTQGQKPTKLVRNQSENYEEESLKEQRELEESEQNGDLENGEEYEETTTRIEIEKEEEKNETFHESQSDQVDQAIETHLDAIYDHNNKIDED